MGTLFRVRERWKKSVRPARLIEWDGAVAAYVPLLPPETKTERIIYHT